MSKDSQPKIFNIRAGETIYANPKRKPQPPVVKKRIKSTTFSVPLAKDKNKLKEKESQSPDTKISEVRAPVQKDFPPKPKAPLKKPAPKVTKPFRPPKANNNLTPPFQHGNTISPPADSPPQPVINKQSNQPMPQAVLPNQSPPSIYPQSQPTPPSIPKPNPPLNQPSPTPPSILESPPETIQPVLPPNSHSEPAPSPPQKPIFSPVPDLPATVNQPPVNLSPPTPLPPTPTIPPAPPEATPGLSSFPGSPASLMPHAHSLESPPREPPKPILDETQLSNSPPLYSLLPGEMLPPPLVDPSAALINTQPVPTLAEATAMPEPSPWPITDSPPVDEPQVDPGMPKEVVLARKRRKFKILSLFTALVVLTTLVLFALRFWPFVNNVVDDNNSGHNQSFAKVLDNLLQTKNQALRVKLEKQKLASLDQNADQSSVTMSSSLKSWYTSNTSLEQVDSHFKFEINLQSASNTNLIILDISTMTLNEQAYFKINNIKFNDQSFQFEQAPFIEYWSDLGDLLAIGNEDASLSVNESTFLQYLDELLNIYSHSGYLILLPVLNIQNSASYLQAQKLLKETNPYNFKASSCRQGTHSSEYTCEVEINYERLYEFYVQLYTQVLDKDLPRYYEILQSYQDLDFNLPSSILLIFDIERSKPIRIQALNTNQIASSSLSIDYESLDDDTVMKVNVENPLSFVEYHRQIKDYENSQQFFD